MRVGCVKLVLVITFVLASVANVGAQDGSGSGEDEIYEGGSAYYEEEYEDYYPSGDGEEFDQCNLYKTENGDQCSHANFPENDDIPGGAMRCCDGHRYK